MGTIRGPSLQGSLSELLAAWSILAPERTGGDAVNLSDLTASEKTAAGGGLLLLELPVDEVRERFARPPQGTSPEQEEQ